MNILKVRKIAARYWIDYENLCASESTPLVELARTLIEELSLAEEQVAEQSRAASQLAEGVLRLTAERAEKENMIERLTAPLTKEDLTGVWLAVDQIINSRVRTDYGSERPSK